MGKRRTVDAFVEFVTRIVDRYKDRVDTWITLNEPVASMIGVGYIGGVWSPGFVFDGSRARRAYFNLMRAHAKAYDAIKHLYGPRFSSVGIAHAMMFAKIAPASDPHGASERARLQFNYFFNWHILNSLLEDQVDVAIEQDPAHRIYQTCQQFFGLPSRPRMDFIGINYYRSVYVETDPGFDALMALTDTRFQGGKFEQRLDVSGSHHHLLNDLAWEIYRVGCMPCSRSWTSSTACRS